MLVKTIEQLKNTIVSKRFVHCYSREFTPANRQTLDRFLEKLKDAYVNVCVDIDIRDFESCETGEQQAMVLLHKINRELIGRGLKPVLSESMSIASALIKWSNALDRRALLVFHCFNDLYSETEMKVLQALRKALTPSPEKKDQISSYLGILIISNRKVSDWELYPYSPIDDRHVTFIELESLDAEIATNS